MTEPVSGEAFDVLVAQTGLPLSEAQKDAIFSVYPILQDMIAKVTEPMPREAEPSLIFVPEVR